MSALILDGQLKSALAIVRSLGMAQIPVVVGAEQSSAMALHSRYASHTFVYPSPYTDQDGFVRYVKAEAIRMGGKPLVYTCSDATFLSLYLFREELAPHMTLVCPESKSIEIAFDKGATYSLARVSGIPTVTTHLPESKDDIVRLSSTLRYPAVLKTRRSVTWRSEKGIFGSASFVQNEAELEAKFLKLKETLGEAPLVQECVYGEEYGVEMLVRGGKPYAMLTHHRLRSLSPTGGASVLKQVVGPGELRDTMEAHAMTLAEKLVWEGPLMVEFKVDSDTRIPLLMEMNGRFWGSLPLATASGLDIPYLFYKEVMEGQTPQEILRGRDGVRSNHFLGGVRHLVRVLFARDPMRARLYPKRRTALRDFLVLPKHTYSDVWSFHDPKPALFEIVDILKRLWR